MSIRRKLASNAAYLFLDWCSSTVFSLLFWIIVGKSLLPGGWGIISTFTGLRGIIITFAVFGVTTAIWKLVPEYLEKNNIAKVGGLIKFSLQIVSLSSITLCLIILLASPYLGFIRLPLNVIRLLAIAVVIDSLFVVSRSVIYGFQDMKRVAITNAFGQISKIVVSIYLLYIGFGYIGALIGLLLSSLVPLLLRLDYLMPKVKSKINRKAIMFEYAFPAFITSIFWIVFRNTQYVLLTVIKDTTVTGLFSIAMTVTSPIGIMPQILSGALFPIISQLSVNKNSRKLQRQLIQSVFRYMLFISLPLAIFLSLFSKPVIILLSRPEYLQASTLFPILALAALIYGCGNIFYSTVYAIGKPKTQRNIAAVTTIIFLLLSIPMTYFYSSIGLSIVYTLSLIILTVLSYTVVHTSLKFDLHLVSIIKLLIASSVSFSFLWTISKLTQDLIIGVVLTILAGLLYLAVLIPLRFYTEKDVKLLYYIASRMPFKKKMIRLVEILSHIIL